jgi:hypothetical protein
MIEWVRCSFQVACGLRLDPCGSGSASSTWRGGSNDRAINPRSHQRLDPTKSRDSDLPRKEVIQPHLPVRLPCYDFVPITNPTFDGCPPCGLAHRLRVLPAFMT